MTSAGVGGADQPSPDRHHSYGSAVATLARFPRKTGHHATGGHERAWRVSCNNWAIMRNSCTFISLLFITSLAIGCAQLTSAPSAPSGIDGSTALTTDQFAGKWTLVSIQPFGTTRTGHTFECQLHADVPPMVTCRHAQTAIAAAARSPFQAKRSPRGRPWHAHARRAPRCSSRSSTPIY